MVRSIGLNIIFINIVLLLTTYVVRVMAFHDLLEELALLFCFLLMFIKPNVVHVFVLFITLCMKTRK